MTAAELKAQKQLEALEALQRSQAGRTDEEQSALRQQRLKEAEDTKRIQADYEAQLEAIRAVRRPMVEAERQAMIGSVAEQFQIGIQQSRANSAAAMRDGYNHLGLGQAAETMEGNRLSAASSAARLSSLHSLNTAAREAMIAQAQRQQLAFISQVQAMLEDFKATLATMESLTPQADPGVSQLGSASLYRGSQLAGPTTTAPAPVLAKSREELMSEAVKDLDELQRCLSVRQLALNAVRSAAPESFTPTLLKDLSTAWWPSIRASEAITGESFTLPASTDYTVIEAAQARFVTQAVAQLRDQIDPQRPTVVGP